MTSTTEAHWARLCALIDDDPVTLSAVQQAAVDPQLDTWLVLIDGLDDSGALAYLDSQDSGVELSDALAGVPRVFRSHADLDRVADVDGDLQDAIACADAILAPHGLRIIYLAEDSEAYPLVVVPIENVDEILTIATRLEHEVRAFD